MNPTLFFVQDSLVHVTPDTVPAADIRNDSTGSLRKFNAEQVDDIFRAMEKRERALDSMAKFQVNRDHLRSLEQKRAGGFDTSAVRYNFRDHGSIASENPLTPLKKQFYSPRDTSIPVFIEPDESTAFKSITQYNPDPPPLPTASENLRPDWLLFIIIGSLILLAWLKLFYNKFFDQTIQSIGNYQLSTKFLRDQNIFSRRVAFALNTNFILIGALYVYLVSGFFHIKPFALNGFLSFLAYAGILSGLLILRFLVSRILGHVFLMQYEFKEYLHQLLLIYKNLGICLLALVIGIAYIREDLRIYLVLLSGLLLLAAFIMRIVKGFKIILNHKGVLIFYLILYLCSLEILPILIFYRFFSSSILTGQV